MVERHRRLLVWKRWGFRLFCCFLAVLTSVLTLVTPFGVAAQSSRQPVPSQTKQPGKSKPDPQVLVVEIVITSKKGDLAGELVDEAYRVIKTQPGRTTTRGQLQKDTNAIFATGYFSNVRAVPENTSLGVRVTFEVVLNPVLQKVQLEGTTVLPETVVAEAFSSKYGSVLNLVRLQEGIKKINKWYTDRGYVLAQVVDAPKVSPDGIVTLNVTEGIIEKIQVQFLTKDSDKKDAIGIPVLGRMPFMQIAGQIKVKTGDIYNEAKIGKELNRLRSLDLGENVEGVRRKLDSGRVIVTIKITNRYTALQRAAKLALDLQDQDNTISAINQYKKVLQLARSNHSEIDEALTLENIASVYKENNSYREAKDFYYQALKIFQGFKAHLLELITYINLGEVHRQLGEPDKALDSYQQALRIQSLLKEDPEPLILFGSLPKKFSFPTSKEDRWIYQLFRYLQPALLFDLATTYAAIGSYQQAFYVLDHAYPTLVNSLNKLNEALFQLLHEQYGTFYKKFGNEVSQTFSRLSEILILLPYDFLYSSVGDPVTGRVYTEQARKKTQDLLDIWKHSINEKDNDKITRYVKSTVDFMSLLLEEKTDDQKVATQVQRLGDSLNSLISETDDKSLKSLLPVIQSYIPILLSSLSKLDDDEQSLLISEQVLKQLDSSRNDPGKQSDWLKSSESWIKPLIFDLQGAAYFRLHRYREALVAYRQAAESSNTGQNSSTPMPAGKNSLTPSVSVSVSPDFASILPLFQSAQNASRLLALGKVYEALNEPENARASYAQFLKLPATSRSTLGGAEANYGVAKAELLLGSTAKAKAGIEAAIVNSEQPPATLTGKSYGPGFTFAELKYGYGLKKVNGGGNRSSVAGGFVLSGRTLDPFTAVSAKPDPASPCNTISAYFACKQKYFEFYINLLLKQQQPDDIGAFEASERARTVTAEVFRASDAVPAKQTPESQPRSNPATSNRRLAGRTRPAPLSEIQSLLDDKTLLLEYFLGDKESYLWAVSKDALKTYFLPGRATIEAKGREFYDLLTAPTGRVRPKTTAKVGQELSAMILGQVADQLGQKRLLIVGDGILQYIPFSTLPDPAVTPNSNRSEPKGEFAPYMQPLLVDHEVVKLLSASAMVELRQNKSSRPTPTKELAVFADPVFNYEDKRVNQAAPARSKRQTHTILSKPVEPIYNALPGTIQEVKQISQFVAPDQRSQFLGFDANYETALSDTLKQYRRIHFATHGFFNVKAPEQSGIVLSAIRKNGELQRGSITPAATLSMDLSAADLVVLSGCRTGLSGELIREGLTGLTGGLMAAGAERVVVSLWSVNDEATEKLMTLFYQNMYKNKLSSNLSPAQALRAAQLSLWQDARWQTPYNWAAFDIYGEWE